MKAAAAVANKHLRPSLKATVERTVPVEWTIAHYDPRLPAILSTPAMIGMMGVAAQAVQPVLSRGATTVGTCIEVDHLRAMGVQVRASARLEKIKGRFLAFKVEARSGRHVLGRGHVYRAIVEPTHFTSKAHRRVGA